MCVCVSPCLHEYASEFVNVSQLVCVSVCENLYLWMLWMAVCLCTCTYAYMNVCVFTRTCVWVGGERERESELGRRKWSWRRRICFRKRTHTKGTIALYRPHTEAGSFSFFTFSRPCLMQYDTVPWHKGVTKTERTWHLLLFCGFPFSINLWKSVWEAGLFLLI